MHALIPHAKSQQWLTLCAGWTFKLQIHIIMYLRKKKERKKKNLINELDSARRERNLQLYVWLFAFCALHMLWRIALRDIWHIVVHEKSMQQRNLGFIGNLGPNVGVGAWHSCGSEAVYFSHAPVGVLSAARWKHHQSVDAPRLQCAASGSGCAWQEPRGPKYPLKSFYVVNSLPVICWWMSHVYLFIIIYRNI